MRTQLTHLAGRALGAAAITSAIFLVACGGGGGGGAAGEGQLRVALTDAPACGYDHVWVTVDRIRVHTSATADDNASGWQELLVQPPRRIDLLALSNGAMEELGEAPLPAGSYQQVRLVLAPTGAASPPVHAVQPAGGSVIALDTPSAQQSGLKLQARVDVPEGQRADLVLDFDACRSVVPRGNSGRYNLKPVVAVVPRTVAGVEGFVTPALAAAGAEVSAQQNGSVVRSTLADAATGRFYLPYLADGSYTVVVSAEGAATTVVTGVPVARATGTTVLNTSANPITPPVSAMRDVTGTVTVGGLPAAQATLRALQALTGGPTVELQQRPADADTGAWLLRLPQAAPVRASFSAGALGPFTTDTPVAGQVRVQALSPSQAPLEQPLNLANPVAPVAFSFP